MLLLFVSILFAVSYNMLFHIFKNKDLRGFGDVLLFNSLLSFIWIIIMLIFNRGIYISAQSWLWGIVYGVIIAGFLLCKMQALSTGPASITSFIGCSSLLLSTGFGILYFEEKVSTVQLIGIIILLFSLFLILNPKQANSIKKQKSWYLWVGLFFIFSGATGIFFKLHQNSPVANEMNQMMLASSITSTVLFFILSIIFQFKADRTMPRVKSSAAIYIIAGGIFSCVYNRLNIFLSGSLPSIVFFPLFNGGVILLTSLSAAIAFREKITSRQLFSIILGFLSLVLTAGVINF